ncbi:hypothetical protein [Celeribacter sp.]|uniref:hypothetical protein n=1 Tax=Celeribacter sp. TaxID=1890673 RepID=UPI003A911624
MIALPIFGHCARLSVTLVAVVALAGCELDLSSGGFGGARERDAVQLTGAGLTIAGPIGYCVDRAALDDSADGAFVLMANCDALHGRRVSRGDDALALLTASASAPLSIPTAFDAERLSSFFGSQSGKAALSRAGSAGTITLIDTFTDGNVFFVHARDSAPNPLGALSDEYWRAVMVVSDRLVSLTVTPYAAAPLSSEQVKRQTAAFAQSVSAANQALPQNIVSENEIGG